MAFVKAIEFAIDEDFLKLAIFTGSLSVILALEKVYRDNFLTNMVLDLLQCIRPNEIVDIKAVFWDIAWPLRDSLQEIETRAVEN